MSWGKFPIYTKTDRNRTVTRWEAIELIYKYI
jgi:hypothetical protein